MALFSPPSFAIPKESSTTVCPPPPAHADSLGFSLIALSRCRSTFQFTAGIFWKKAPTYWAKEKVFGQGGELSEAQGNGEDGLVLAFVTHSHIAIPRVQSSTS